MAGRYSKEYRPSEFVKLPFEEVAKVMAMKEQQYQQGYLQPAAYQQEMGKVEVRTPDIEYHQQLIKQATDKARQLAEETYGGDYGAAASDITRTLANEASNPFYSWTKSKMDEYKKAKAIDMELTAKGQKLGFNTDLLNKSYFDKENNIYNTELGFDVEQKLDYAGKATEIIQKNLVDAHKVWEESLAQAAKHGTTQLGNKDFISQYTNITEGKMLKDKDSAYNQFKSTPEYTQWKKTLTSGIESGKPMSDEKAEESIKNTFTSMISNMADVRYSRTVNPIDATIPKETNSNGSGGGFNTTFDLMQKQLPSTEEERNKAIEDSKKSNDARKSNLENSLSNAFGIKVTPGVKFSVDNLTDYISDKIDNAQKYVENLFGGNKNKQLSPLDMKINAVENKISKDPTFNNLKLTYPSIYKKAKLANKSINEFVDDVAKFEASVNAKPTVQYYTENDKFQKNLEEDFRRLNKNSEDKDIYDTTNGEYISFEDMLQVMDKAKKDSPDNPSPYKISTYKDGVAIIKGKDIYKMPKEYLSPERANALDLVSKAENIYRMYNDETGDAASGHVVRSNGINLFVLPGKGYIPISGSIPTSYELTQARLHGYKNIRNITNDIMAMIAMSTVD